MKKTKTILLIIVFTILSTQGLKAAWHHNGIPEPTSLKSLGSNLNINGASYFLQAMASFYLLLNESELSSNGIITSNNINAKNYLEDIIDKLSLSRDYFYSLLTANRISTVENTTLYQLRNFNYDQFLLDKKCNPFVMERLKSFLQKGDIIGYQYDLVKSLDQSINKIKKLSENLQTSGLIKLDNLQSIYDNFNEAALYGYYTSLIFSTLK